MQDMINAKFPDLIIKQKNIDDETRRLVYGPNSTSRLAGVVYTIPVVVHVVHFGGTGLGTAENISEAQVLQAMQDMNDAFRNLGFYDPGTGADVEIEFCLASQDPLGDFTTGITRTASNTYTDLDSDTEDAGLKVAAQQWDPTSYCNIWLVNQICSSVSGSCGSAGYSYTSSSHGQPWDGIVVEAGFFGSSQDNSKVHIHEMGHYMNLVHTFEDACINNDCTTDGDQVCDTPPDNSTNAIACGATSNSCSTDEDDTSINNPFRPIGLGGLGEQNDMTENYMDYNFQSCQDRFTGGQVARMRIALTGIRSSLLASTGCVDPSSPEIYFSSSIINTNEEHLVEVGNCSDYRDVTVSMDIGSAATGDAIVTINYAGTATSGADYNPQTATPEITFASGSTNTETFTIRIWDDASAEGDETIELTYSIGGSTDAIPSSFNQTLVITIEDDDNLPLVAGKKILLNEDFEGGFPAGWNEFFFLCPCTAAAQVWEVGTAGGHTANSMYISTDGGTTRADNLNDIRQIALGLPSLDATAIAQDIFLEFDLDIDGDATNDYFEIYYNINGAGWLIWQSPIHSESGTQKYTLPASFQGSNFELSFLWNSNGDGSMVGNVPALDNIKIYTEGHPSIVETTLSNNEVSFGPNTTVYVYNGPENDLVARVVNLSNWDYGCTTFEIDRIGNTAQQYQNSSATGFVTDKTLLITPSNNNPSGNYEIRMYLSADEVLGWEAATLENRGDLTLFKASNPINTVTGTTEQGFNSYNANYNSSEYYVNAEFSSGFGGFAAHSSTCSPLNSCNPLSNNEVIENNFGEQLLIYPNPTKGNLIIDIGQNEELVEISVTNENGKLINSKTFKNRKLLKLEIKGSTGLYFLKIESGDKKAIIRILKE